MTNSYQQKQFNRTASFKDGNQLKIGHGLTHHRLLVLFQVTQTIN